MTTFPIQAPTAEQSHRRARNTEVTLAWLWCFMFWVYGPALYLRPWTTVITTVVAVIILLVLVYMALQEMILADREFEDLLRDQI